MNIEDMLTVATTVFGAGGFGAMLIKGIRDWRRGKINNERAYNLRMLQESLENELKADMEVANRLALQEYASILRRMLIELGVGQDELPEEPAIRKKYKED